MNKLLTPTPLKRVVFFLIFDFILSFVTLYSSYLLRFNFNIPKQFIDNFLNIFIILFIIKIIVFVFFKLYRTAWRFFSLYEVKKIMIAHIIVYTVFTVIFLIFYEYMMPLARSIIVIDLFLSMIAIIFLRLFKRMIIEGNKNNKYKNTLLIGASESINTILKDKSNIEYTPVAIVDEQKMLIGTYVSNLMVSNIDQLENIIKSKSIEAVIITKQYSQEQLNGIYDILNKYEINDIKIVHGLANGHQVQLKDVSVEDLLARHPKDLDKDQIKLFIKNKIILVTGAGGSIGSEIVRQCCKFDAKQIIMLDHSEFNLYSIEQEVQDHNTISVMQSIKNKAELEKIFAKYTPDIVIHAAAYKHVPLVEANISAGILNNIIGTKNVIDTAIQYNVKKVVLISTDKAVRPTNVMGTTKRVCELYAQNVDSKSTEIVAVRFGNVLGSSGSVIPKFKSQIQQGKNITVTHPDITRYFMLIPEACELVLQAASIGTGAEIFILDMGEPIKIVDLAKKMIELSGRDDIDIEFTGLRPGEKLYEELLIDDSDASTDYESITVAKPTKYDINQLNKDIDQLLVCEDKIAQLKKIVPEFNHQLN
jgi:UDP-N-acetyl-D-glucosamine 4,6-dehydratase